MASHLRRLAPHLDNYLLTPLLHSFVRITLSLERGYQVIRDGESLLGEDGEIRASFDAVRRMAETQSRLAEKLGLTPATLRSFQREKPVDLAAAMADQDESDDDEKALAN
jgi:hypothetical protein